MIIIDYLQLMSVGGSDSKGGNREQEISTISRSIKQIAKELDVPVIALSQLSRQVETRSGDKRPVLSDLRESGAIEQDADIVGFIYRPEYYGILTDAQGNSTHGLAQILIAKHRNGAVTDVDLEFKGHLAKFTNRDHSFPAQYGRDTLGANTAFEQGGTTTITMSSKINNMDDDDEPFDYSGGSPNDPVPF
jgi:replicative DNA helicase